MCRCCRGAGCPGGIIEPVAVIVDPDHEARTRTELTLGGPGCAEVTCEEAAIEPVVVDGRVDGVNRAVELADTTGRSLYLDLTTAWELTDPIDAVMVDGGPPVTIELPDGYHGDMGTTARVVRALQAVPHLTPGFYRPVDLPIAW